MVSSLGQRIKQIRQKLGLTQEKLAQKAGLPYTTLTKVESGVIKNPSVEVVGKITKALDIPVEEISDIAPSLDLKRAVTILKGQTAIPRLLDDVYQTLKKTGGEVLISSINEKKFLATHRQALQKQIKRLAEAGIYERLLAKEGDMFLLPGPQSAYRWIPESMFSPTLFYVYADKLAMVLWGPPQQAIIIQNLNLADAYRKQFLFIWDKAQIPSTKQVTIDERNRLEQALLKRFGGKVTSLTDKDKKLFHDFLTKETSQTYGNSFYYLCQAANGTGAQKLGLKYYDGETLIALGIFNRASLGGGWHYFLNHPLGKFEPHKILQFSRALYELSANPVFVKKITDQAKEGLLKIGFSPIEEYPWHAQAMEEDDTYPEQIINISEVLSKMDSPGKRNLKNQYNYFLRKVADKKLEFVNLTSNNQQHAFEIVQKFFDYLEHKEVHISIPSDYDNMILCPPLGKNSHAYLAQLFYINRQPAAFYAVEPINKTTAGLYANITLHEEFPNLSEYLLTEICRKLKTAGFKYLNLGGSETPGLFQFKEKFSPIKYNKMHWVVYKM